MLLLSSDDPFGWFYFFGILGNVRYYYLLFCVDFKLIYIYH
jgi:hypothetical protein